ncbi:DMT family transporter [Maribellus sp. YY47]|uniref:DMT family transporter n=1 Tax=Maribellus sp. YY47 TaxID=2929486 RepID=UPI0020005F3B|nr:DMT family transporter [Maribellus sp. YY47]MCK3686262.1 DMT family transporter [Maribellus sp. YY47]
MKSNTYKGYVFALVATLAFSNVYIFSKAALNEIPLAQFGSLWYFIVSVSCMAFALFNKKLKQVAHLTRKQVIILLTLGLLEIATTTLFFLSIHIIPDPSVTSFLGNIYPVMVMLGGIFILHERFGPIEILGGFLALAGAFAISYSGGTTLETLFIKGTGVVFFNAIFATTATLVVKAHVQKLSPELLNLNRAVWLFTFSIIMFFVMDESTVFSAEAIKNTAIGAVLEFIAILTVYYSFRYIEASRSSIVQSMKGIFVLLGAFLFFGTLPLRHQLIGGFLTVLGVLIMALAQAGVFRTKKKA